MVSKNCANFVLNCTAISKFCAVRLSVDWWGPGGDNRPRFEFLVQNRVKNYADFVLNCAAIFKFYAAPFGKYSQRRFYSQHSLIANFDFEMVSKIVLILYPVGRQFAMRSWGDVPVLLAKLCRKRTISHFFTKTVN